MPPSKIRALGKVLNRSIGRVRRLITAGDSQSDGR
jgi:hypothetical protein